MTIDEAIEYNKNLRMYMKLSDKNQPYKFLEENYIALYMAIKALEQQPCEDTISRQAVLEQTYNWSKDEFLRVTNPFDYLRKRINSLPSVTPVTENEKFLEFLWNTINPNEMEQYLAMYHAKEEKVNG